MRVAPGIILAAVMFPTVSMGDEQSERRATCTPLVTAVYDGCLVENHYRCPDGGTYAEELSLDSDLTISLMDAGYNMVYDYDIVTGAGVHGVLSARDPFEMDRLLADGRETEDITVAASYFAGVKIPTALEATYRLSSATRAFSVGQMRVIDFTQSMEVGFGGNRAKGTGVLYLDQSLGTYFIGSASLLLNGAQMDLPSLIDVVGPDSPFFMTQNPEDTCQDPLS